MNAQTKFFKAPLAVDISKPELMGRRPFIKTARFSILRLPIDLGLEKTPERLDELSQHVNGCDFDQAPTEWQRFIEDMVRKGVKFKF
jgi:hypothetical protein